MLNSRGVCVYAVCRWCKVRGAGSGYGGRQGESYHGSICRALGSSLCARWLNPDHFVSDEFSSIDTNKRNRPVAMPALGELTPLTHPTSVLLGF